LLHRAKYALYKFVPYSGQSKTPYSALWRRAFCLAEAFATGHGEGPTRTATGSGTAVALFPAVAALMRVSWSKKPGL
jgi:hypothetical protein